MPENTENHDLILTAQEAVTPFPVVDLEGNDSGLFIVRDSHGTTRALDLREQLGLLPEHPARKTGTLTFTDPMSLIGYLGKHEEPSTEVYADDRACTITAVINAHGASEAGLPGYADHKAVLTMRRSEDWKDWTKNDGQLMAQALFAEFMEDHLPNFVDPTGADMLELAQTFQATTKVDFASSQRVKSGETQLVYSEQQSASAGKKGSLAIPDTFAIGVQVFERGEAYKVQARFRYRINDGRLLLGYRLTRPRDVLQTAFDEVVETVTSAITPDIWAV